MKHDRGNLLKLAPANKEQNIGFSYDYSFIRGVPDPKVDSLFNYVLPFKKGKTIKINESSNLGEKYLGQEKPINWKSYVIDRTDADTVCSVRKRYCC